MRLFNWRQRRAFRSLASSPRPNKNRFRSGRDSLEDRCLLQDRLHPGPASWFGFVAEPPGETAFRY
jgi:hypothetical protein